MPLEQKLTSTSSESPPSRVSAIENEIPTYRAVSPGAVFALIFGALSILSLASPYFLAFAIAAVVAGALADRKIQRMPDVLTGRRLAQTAIGLALVFGLGSTTMLVVQDQLRKAEAARFAKRFAKTLENGTLEDAFWYKQFPAFRKGKTSREAYEEVVKSLHDPRMIDMEIASYRAIKQRLASPGEDVRFAAIEDHGGIGFQSYAAARLELRGPGSKDYPEKKQYALVVMKGERQGGKLEWWIEDLKFPYTPSTYQVVAAPVDDGHGHAGGGHSH